MAPRKNSDWLYAFQEEGDWFLMCGNSLREVTTSLSNPRSQYPSIVLLIGKNHKDAAQKALLPGHRDTKSQAMAQLRLDSSTLNSDSPLLIASIDADRRPHLPRHHSGELRHKLEWLPEKPSANSVLDTITSKLLLLFVDVVCLFLDDFSTYEEGVAFFQQWVEKGNFSQPWRPRLIVVTKERWPITNFRNLPTFECKRRVKLKSRDNRLPHPTKHQGLKRAILQDIYAVKRSKRGCRMLFSASHLNALFKSAVQHVAKSIISDFNFIHAARQANRLDTNFGRHLKNFLDLCVANHASKEFVLRYIASVMILDSLPPAMHCRPPCILTYEIRAYCP
jgi:hypothetical protein